MIDNVKKVTVKYNERTVGYLAEVEENVFAFQYDDEWLKTGFSISPFSLPLEKGIFVSKQEMFDGLFCVFRDSLPDGWGELLMNRLLQKKGINLKKLSPLTRLSLINKNGLGGLTYEPSNPLEALIDGYDLDSLSVEVEKILNDDDTCDLDEVYRLGGSSGGARPKAHIRFNNEEWIVKFACRIDSPDIGIMEYRANETAKKCGINVNEYRLFTSSTCPGYFGVKRFDRLGKKRIHMISLAALLETTHKIPNMDYIHLLQVIDKICADKSDLYEGFRRMCFNVYYGNKDDHSKNFAFLYNEEKGSYELSPAFDITKTPDKFEHEMTVNGAGNPTDKDILAVARRFKLSTVRCKEMMAQMKEIIGV
jgi:serine/threonine-protein kinase HipA